MQDLVETFELEWILRRTLQLLEPGKFCGVLPTIESIEQTLIYLTETAKPISPEMFHFVNLPSHQLARYAHSSVFPTEETTEKIAHHASLSDFNSILEVGSHHGSLAKRLEGYGFLTWAIDYGEEVFCRHETGIKRVFDLKPVIKDLKADMAVVTFSPTSEVLMDLVNHPTIQSIIYFEGGADDNKEGENVIPGTSSLCLIRKMSHTPALGNSSKPVVGPNARYVLPNTSVYSLIKA